MAEQNLSSFIWFVADLLRADCKQSEYGRVVFPLTVLRRLDCVLDPTKPGVVRSIFDPTAGSGGMRCAAGKHLAALNSDAQRVMYGQELNPESYANCKADTVISLSCAA